jgi:hypothetical protein
MFRSRRSNVKGTSRSQIGVQEVRDDMLVLPGNRYRLVLSTSSVNFELQSEAEQDVLVETYQAFLNSLTTPIQILVRVRELDIDQYLNEFEAAQALETKAVYRQQLQGYTKFVRKLVSGNKILSRRFYVVIPYDAGTGEDSQLIKEQLMLRQEIIVKGLERLGITSRQLSSLEILDLFYGFYQPERSKIQPLTKELLRQANATDYL